MVINNHVFSYFNNRSKHKNHTCHDFENQYKDGLKEFYVCAVESTNKDFWFCKNCSGSFSKMFYGYELLKTKTDLIPGHNNVSCISEVINTDRMNFWFRIHEEAVKLWDDANCYKCYDWNGTLINGTVFQKQNWTEDFVTFMNLTERLEVCEELQKDKDPCNACAKNYTELNKFYEKIKKKYQTNMCFDIENSMNRTRRYWSGNLGCCRDDEASFLVFTIMASVIGSLPILFYYSAYFMTKRAEDYSPVTDGETQCTPNVPSVNNHEQLPGTSSAASSNASTAILDDTPTFLINNNTKPNAFKNTNIKNIVKKSNIEVNPNNLHQSNATAQPSTQSPEPNPSQSLIDLERSPLPTSLMNFEDTSGTSNDLNVRKFM